MNITPNCRRQKVVAEEERLGQVVLAVGKEPWNGADRGAPRGNRKEERGMRYTATRRTRRQPTASLNRERYVRNAMNGPKIFNGKRN